MSSNLLDFLFQELYPKQRKKTTHTFAVIRMGETNTSTRILIHIKLMQFPLAVTSKMNLTKMRFD